MRYSAAAAGWLLTAGVLAAQHSGPALISPLRFSAGRDSNFLVGARELDDTVSVLSLPRMALLKWTPRTQASVEYQPEFEIFARHRDLNAWNHSAGLRFVHRLTPRLSMELGDWFVHTRDPGRSMSESFFRMPRSRFQENSAYASLGYNIGPLTTVSVRFDNTVTFTNIPGLERLGVFDGLTSAATADISRVITRRQRVSGAYSYLILRPLGDNARRFQDSDITEPMHNVSSTYVFEVNPRLAFSFSGGAIRSDRLSYSMAVQMEKAVGSLRMIGAYNRYLSFFSVLQPDLLPDPAAQARFASGVLPQSLYEVVSFKLSGKLTRRIGMDVLAMRPTSKLEPRDRDLRGLVGRLRLDYRLSERLVVFSNAEYYGQNLNEVTGVPLSRKRYFGGIEVLLQRLPDPRKEEPASGPLAQAPGNR